MPIYFYKAKKKTAETVAGQVAAESKESAVEKIIQMGLTPITVEEGSSGGRAARKNGRVSSKELYFFSRQLVILIKAGVPILRALEIIADQIRNLFFQQIVRNVHFEIKEGRSFSEALAQYPRVFSSLYVVMVKAGEESGRLKETVNDMASYQRRQVEILSKVRTALAYPLFMATFGAATVVFTLTYVMPRIAGIFSNLNQTLPAPTLFVMRLSAFLLEYWWALLLGGVLIAAGLGQWNKTQAARMLKSRLTLRLPWLGEFFIKLELARFCRTLELLLKSGIPILRAIQLSTPIVDNVIIKSELQRCQQELAAGKSFGNQIRGISFVPPIVGHLVSVGEESGSLDSSLHEISQAFEQETDEAIKVMTTFLEPLMIVLIGGSIGFLIIAMLLPVFQLDVFAR
ncbi:MAG: type II secretion system F family protein [Candidatus Omnitrophota bacterium]|nr:type II secretion system F family protein [Candidatus Omnitrophota bacterium]MDZ4242082.1 type II secretion system F family protein [Candidatus Omnitrophota bacterium]